MTPAEMNPREMTGFPKLCLFKHLVGKKKKLPKGNHRDLKKKNSYDKLHSNLLLRKEITVSC